MRVVFHLGILWYTLRSKIGYSILYKECILTRFNHQKKRYSCENSRNESFGVKDLVWGLA